MATQSHSQVGEGASLPIGFPLESDAGTVADRPAGMEGWIVRLTTADG